MTTAQVVETSVTVNNNSPIQDYVHPDDQTQPTFEIVTSHAKTYTNGFPLNGWNARLSNGWETAHEAVWNGWNRTADNLFWTDWYDGWTASEKFRTDGNHVWMAKKIFER